MKYAETSHRADVQANLRRVYQIDTGPIPDIMIALLQKLAKPAGESPNGEKSHPVIELLPGNRTVTEATI